MVKETEQDIREILLSTPEMSKYLTSKIHNVASFCPDNRYSVDCSDKQFTNRINGEKHIAV